MTQHFVTGATGFIGGHLVPTLLARGHDVEVLKRPGPDTVPQGARVVEGDVTRPDTLRPARNAERITHLAAISFVPETVKDPVTAFRVNAEGTLHLLEEARRSETLTRFVYMSTGHVYGPARYTPIDEAHPLEPVSPYGATKLAGERLVKAYHETYGLPVVILRAFNVYGPGQSTRFLVPEIVQQLLSGKAPHLGDGRPVRDFTYVSDFVDLVLRAGEAPDAVGEAFNVGTGRGHAVSEVADTLVDIAGVKGEPFYDRSRFRTSELRELVVKSDKARDRLGWKPAMTLRKGLERTWEAARTGAWTPASA